MLGYVPSRAFLIKTVTSVTSVILMRIYCFRFTYKSVMSVHLIQAQLFSILFPISNCNYFRRNANFQVHLLNKAL